MREVMRIKPGQIRLNPVVRGEFVLKVPPAILIYSLALSLLTACQTPTYDPRIDSARWDPPAPFAGEYDGQIHLNQVKPAQVMIECEKLGIPSVTGKQRDCASLTTHREITFKCEIGRNVHGSKNRCNRSTTASGASSAR